MSFAHYEFLRANAERADLTLPLNNELTGDTYYLQTETVYVRGEAFTVRRLCVSSECKDPYAPAGWMLAAEMPLCTICGEEFGMFKWKRHCKACGNVVCSDCSPETAIILELLNIGPLRACVHCYWGQVNLSLWI